MSQSQSTCYLCTEALKVGEYLLCRAVVDHLALGEEGEGGEEGEDGVAGLVDGQNNDPCLTQSVEEREREI